MCVCRITSGPQHFFIGDFADGSDPEDLKFGLESRGSSEPREKLRALRHLGSGGGSEDLRGPDESGSLRHLGSGGGGEDLQGLDESGSLRHLGSGGEAVRLHSRDPEVDGDICGFQVGPGVSKLQPVKRPGTGEESDPLGTVEWTRVASEEQLGIGGEQVFEGLRSQRLYLLVTDHEERDAFG